MPAPISPETRQALLKRRQQKKPHAAAPPRVSNRPVTSSHAPAAHAPAPTGHAPAAAADPAAATPASVTAPLTPEQLDTEAAAAIRQRYGGQEREIVGQQRVSDQMQTNLGSWFDQYKADVEAARQRTADFNTGVQAAQAQQAQQAEGVDVGQAATPEAKQAAAARRSTSDSFGSMLAAQSGAENAYQADQGRIGGGEAVHQHIAEAGRKRSLGEDLTALKGEEGDFEVGYRADARAAERKNELERKAFDLDVDTAAADAENKANQQNKYGFTPAEWAALPEATKKSYRDGTNKPKAPKTGYGPGAPGMNKYGYTADEWNALSGADKDKARAGNGTKPKPKGPTAADKRAEQARIDKIRGKSQTALNRLDQARSTFEAALTEKIPTGAKDADGHDVVDKNGLPVTRPATEADAVHALAMKGYSANEIHLMRLIQQGKKWGPQEVAMAHQLGIRVPRSYLSYDPNIKAGSKNDPKDTSGQQNGIGGK